MDTARGGPTRALVRPPTPTRFLACLLIHDRASYSAAPQSRQSRLRKTNKTKLSNKGETTTGARKPKELWLFGAALATFGQRICAIIAQSCYSPLALWPKAAGEQSKVSVSPRSAASSAARVSRELTSANLGQLERHVTANLYLCPAGSLAGAG